MAQRDMPAGALPATAAHHPGVSAVDRARSGAGPLEPALLAAVALLETLAIGWLAGNGGKPLAYLGVHLATMLVLALLVALAAGQSRDTTPTMLALIAGTAMGPAGALGGACLGLLDGRGDRPGPLVEQWYERIALSAAVDPATRLCDDVGVGRTLDLGAEPPPAFPSIMASGTLAQRQAVLGHIARNFHADYLPTLRIALESPEPVLRVQAAAVAAHIGPKVRRHFALRAAETAAAEASPMAALGLLTELEALIGSGLLDERERLAGTELVRRLGDAVLAGLGRAPLNVAAGADIAAAARLESSLERLLVERGCFARLRSERAARRIGARHPKARFRRLGGRRPGPRPGAAA
jgi:hypothetical protein